YATTKVKSLWFAWLHLSRLAAASTAAMLLLSAFAVTGYAAYNSAPGQTLFAVKKSAEKLQMVLAYNQNQKASLQIEITQKRLDEAREILQNPASNIEQEKAALTELTAQTNNAIEVINTVTTNNPKANDNHPLLSSLETITKQQQALLKEIKPNGEINEAAGTALVALNKNSAKISEIKQSIAIASNDQTLAKLNDDSDLVTVLGKISAISKTNLTVEKTAFTIGSQTVIKNASGEIITFESLKPETKISIPGKKDKETLVAKDILVINETGTEPEVKSASTTPDIKPSASTTSTSAIAEPEKPVINPNQAQGSYIFEDPNPQFVK
ncbi:MAG: DUF5667 domain-containing protein, partial [Candidatus Doudnabacteria bacterium]